MSSETEFVTSTVRRWLGRLEKAGNINTDNPNAEIAEAANILLDALSHFCDDDLIMGVGSSGELKSFAIFMWAPDPNIRAQILHISAFGSLVDEHGMGRALMNEVILEAKRIDLDAVAVHPSEKSESFYTRLGFVPYPGSYEGDLIYWIRKPT